MWPERRPAVGEVALAARPRIRGLVCFARVSSFFLVMRLVGAATTFATYLLLARWMGAAELGYYVVAFSWCLVLTRCATLGLGCAATRFAAGVQARDEPGLVRGYVRRSRALVAGAALALGVGGALLAVVLGAPDDPGGLVLRVALLAIPFLAWLTLHTAVALALSWPRPAVIDVALGPTGLLLGVVVAWLLADSIDAFAVICIHVGVMLVLLCLQLVLFERTLDREVPKAPPLFETRAWVATALPLILVTLYGSFFFEYSVLFLSLQVSAEALGVFSVAYKVAFLLGFMTWAVDSATLPQLSRLRHQSGDVRRLQEALASATRLRTAACGLGFLGLAALGPALLRFAGPGFEGAYVVMLVVAASLVVRAALGPSSALLVITGHPRVRLVASAVSLAAAPLLLFLSVPRLGILGAALSIFVVTTASSLWLHRQVRLRLGVYPSVLGPISIGRKLWERARHEDRRFDPRRSVIQVCGPDLVRKTSGSFVHAEYAKAEAVWRVAQEHAFLAPRPLRIDEAGGAIELEYVRWQGRSKDCYLDYVTRRGSAPHPMPDLAAAAGRALAHLHEHLRLPMAEEWRPAGAFLKDLERCGVSAGDLAGHPIVPLHGDYCLDNLAFRLEDGVVVPVVFDPSPNFVVTHHPAGHGPRYVDLGLFLSCLEGRVSARRYPWIRWARVPGLKARFLEAYLEAASVAIDPHVADAVGYCIAREHFRQRFGYETVARVASWLLYNRLKGNSPRP